MTLPVLRESLRPKLIFEKSYWGKAGEDFIKYLDTEKKINDPSKIKKIVEDVCTIGQAISSIEGSQKKGKDSYGGKVSKILNNMHYFFDLGDIAVKGGPESVGIVWMGFKIIFAGIQADYKACQLLADISSTTLGLMIQCRVYGAMFDYRENPTEDETGALGEVQKCIRAAYLGILKFSYRAKTYIERHTFLKDLKAILIDPNFKKDAENINDLGDKLRMFAGVAIQRRVDDNQGAMLENDKYLIKIAEVHRKENRAAFEDLKTELSQIAEEVHGVKVDVEFVKDKMTDAEQDRLLKELPCAGDAAFDSQSREGDSQCLPDTRVDLLDQIMRWSDNPSSRCIFWLSGMAGTGKSTISRTVAHAFTAQDRLGASFFFTRGSSDLANTTKFFTSLARQLADKRPSFKRALCTAIDRNPGIAGKYLREQWKALIAQPLESSSFQSSTLIFVIDALDECDESGDKIQLVLRLLAEAKNLKTVQLRIFITSRPETLIRLGFNKIDEEHQDVVLHEAPRSDINHDISVFVKHELENIKKEEQTLPADWPGGEKIQDLVQRADGLFIYAATACRFIGSTDWTAIEGLSYVLEDDAAGELLDKMYTQVLKHSIIGDYPEKYIKKLGEQFRQIVGSIVILFDPLSATALAKLLHVEKGMVDRRLGNLRSVLDVPESQDSPIRLLHTSFRDFLLDKKRCLDHQFWVDSEETHRVLAESCIKAMSDALKRDICGLGMPGVPTSEVESNRVARCLPVPVQYACRYWVCHIECGKFNLCDKGLVHTFLQNHLLHWLEALSLMGNMSDGVVMLRTLESILIPESSIAPESFALIQDAKRFILAYRSIIEKAPLQIYTLRLSSPPRRA